MARKNQWQQFADNFDAVYGTLNSFGKDMDASRIMNEEVEEVQNGLGPGPRSQYIAKYDGKTYNEQITPEMLKGLRNQRLIDSMAKFGDSEGAMKMQLDQATLRNQDNQADLAEGQLADRIANSGLQNEALLASIGLTKQQIEESKTLLPHKRTEYILNAVRTRSDNRVATGTEDSRIAESGSSAALVQSQAEIAETEAKELELTSHMRVMSTKEDFQAQISSNRLLTLENKVALGPANEALAVNDMMTTFRDLAKGDKFKNKDGSANNQAAKDWMVDQLSNINPTLSSDLKANYNQHEVAELTQQSVIFKQTALNAWQSGGIKGVAEAIDEMNGLNDTDFVIDEKSGYHVLNEVDPETKEFIREIAKGNNAKEFEANLMSALDPAGSMATSKAYMDTIKDQADLEYTQAMTAESKARGVAAGKTTPLTEKQYFTQRLIKDPNDKVAMYGLMGEKMSMEDIDQLILTEALKKDDDKKPGEAREDKDFPIEDGVKKTSVDKYENVAGTTGVTNTQVDLSLSQDEQAKQTFAAKKEINDRIWSVWDVIKKDIIPWTKDSKLKATDLAAQVRRDTALSWLRNNWGYFGANPAQLKAFEDDPEGWVAKNTKGLK